MSKTTSNQTLPKESKRRSLGKWCVPIAISAVALLATPWLLGPRVPDRIAIATGSEQGAYFAFANRYKEILERDGITVEVRSTVLC